MYAAYFGLQRDAFSIAPDPQFLFLSERHREALAHLIYGLEGGGGFVVLGDVGTGKTTVCHTFLQQVPAHCNVAYIFNPKLSATELLQSVAQEFGIPGAEQARESVKHWVDALNRYLLEQHGQQRVSVLVIDEAQNLERDVLEQLRLLTNLETNERKLLQIILIGQPELRDMLARPDLEQLAQRVIARYHLEPLNASETSDYLDHRLAVAGLQGPSPLDRGAVKALHAASSGVPRRINLIAARALLAGYAAKAHSVNARMVRDAGREVLWQGGDGAPSRSVSPAWLWAFVGLGGAALGAVLALWAR
jgi:general secretion pathway protein A